MAVLRTELHRTVFWVQSILFCRMHKWINAVDLIGINKVCTWYWKSLAMLAILIGNHHTIFQLNIHHVIFSWSPKIGWIKKNLQLSRWDLKEGIKEVLQRSNFHLKVRRTSTILIFSWEHKKSLFWNNFTASLLQQQPKWWPVRWQHPCEARTKRLWRTPLR